MKKWFTIAVIACTAAASANYSTSKKAAVILDNFNTGQVSPKLEARQDYPKYDSSMRTLENFIINPLGPVQRRPGTRYVATVKTGTPRIIPFEYSTDDVYAIEMGDEYMRFYRNGAQILAGGGGTYEIVSPFDSSELSSVRYAQSGNLMYLVDGNDVPQILTRTAHNAWTIGNIAQEGGPFLNENETETSTIAASAVTGTGVTLTATSGPFDSDHVGALWQISHIVEANDIDGRFWTSGDSNSATISVMEDQTYTVTTGGDWYGTFNIERSYDAGSTWQNVKSFAARGNTNVLYNGVEAYDDALYRVTMRDQLVTGHMVRHGEGECDYTLATDSFTRNGIVSITAVADANSATATVITDLASTDATWRWSEGMWSGYRGWPKTVAFHQQRAVYGGSDSYPTVLWWSQTGSDGYDDFLTGTLDTDAFWVDLTGMNPIRWILSGDYLLIGTSGSVGRYGKQGMPITPTTPGWVEQSDHGSAEIQAVVAGDTVLYVERNARKIREFGYNLQYDRYTTPDLTVLSEEITDPNVLELAFQTQPYPILWCLLGDGDIAALCYYRGEAVVGWSQQNTDGDFKSVATMPGSGTTPAGDTWTEDEVWTVATRDVNGTDYTFIEQFTPVEWGSDSNDCWFLDSALSTSGDLGGGSSVFTGLSHLAGETVTVYADANCIGTAVVSGAGAITLAGTYTNVTAGLPYTSKFETLPLRLSPSIPLARISDFKIMAVNADLYETGYLKYALSKDAALTTADFGTDFVSNTIDFSRFVMPYGTREKYTVYIESAQPAPLTVRALISEAEYYPPR
jgi:hypothetical protein